MTTKFSNILGSVNEASIKIKVDTPLSKDAEWIEKFVKAYKKNSNKTILEANIKDILQSLVDMGQIHPEAAAKYLDAEKEKRKAAAAEVRKRTSYVSTGCGGGYVTRSC